MYLRFYINENGDKVYTTKKETPLGLATQSAHPARFSPDDKYSRQRVLLKKRFGLLQTQQPSPNLHMDAISSSAETVIKPPTDRRHYRFMQLCNGLGALLVHDPCIYLDGKEVGVGGSVGKKAAAAMSVGLGSFADPKDAQGLAHFLEHMLFWGSTSFEKENEFDSYLSEHGGFSNSYTGIEHTCYFFDVEGKSLFGALERFAQIFISPLMNPDAMQREISSVDSEFVGILQNDFVRRQRLQCHTSTPGCPFNRFFWGNKKSLSDALEDSKVRDCLMKLHDDYCCGDMMKLVVIGGESLDILESWVLQLFNSVKKGSLVKPETSLDGPIWRAGKIYKLEALSDVHVLELSWQLPSLAKDYLKKGEEYISHLLGHEGKGSIFHLLKTRGWAFSMDAGVHHEGMYRSAIAYIFRIIIHLTDVGVEKIFEVIDYVYQYLKRMVLLSPQKWIFEELHDIGKLGFMMAEEKPEASYAKYLAENLRVYPPEHAIHAEHAYEIWDEKLIKDILGLLKPSNMRVDLQTKYFKKSLGSSSQRKKSNIEIEPWFDLEYIEEDIPGDWMQSWENPPTIDSSLHLPSENVFISHDVSIRANVEVRESTRMCILEEAIMTLWYKFDKTHKLPFVNTHFHITLNGADSSSRNLSMTRLFTLLLNDELNEITYMGNEARLETAIFHNSGGLVLKVDGLVDKLPVYLSKVLAVFKSFLPKDDRFRVIKEDMERTLRNAHTKPLDNSNYTLKRVLLPSFRSVEDRLDELRHLSPADLEAFIPDLLSKLHIEGHCHGNLLKEEALQIAEVFTRNFSVPLVPRTSKVFVVRLPPSANLVKDVSTKNERDKNSSVQLYFQIGRNTAKLYVLAKLFAVLVQEPFYNELRTKMQLGYELSCGVRLNHGILGFYFYVQSSKFHPEYLQNKMVAFIKSLRKMLNGLDSQEFESHKNKSLGMLLDIENQECFCETTEVGNSDFGLWSINSETLATEYSRKKKADLISWYNTYLRKPSPNCQMLAIRVWGRDRDLNKLKVNASTMQVIEEIDDFKRQSELYTGESAT